MLNNEGLNRETKVTGVMQELCLSTEIGAFMASTSPQGLLHLKEFDFVKVF